MPHRMTHVQRRSGNPSDTGTDTAYEGEIVINSISDTLQFRSNGLTHTVLSTQEDVGAIANVTPVVARAIVMKYTDNSAAGAAGTFSASVVVPAGATLVDIIVDQVALWNQGTSASLEIGHTDPDGYFTAVDLKATDLLAGESLSFALAGGVQGAYIANSHVSPRYSASARSILATIVTAGTAATTGETRITVLYTLPSTTDIVTSTFVAA